jgi:L,D-transpeptidase YbiS
MKKDDVYSRFGVLLLVAALGLLAAGAFFVITLQLNTVSTISNQVETLTNELGILREEMTRVRAENDSFKDTDRHIAVSLRENKLFLMEGRDVLRVCDVATGSGRKFWRFGKEYDFTTPPGRYSILKKDVDPVWIAPDWHWHERGETVPENISLAERSFPGVMGKYALRLGDGYAIHGTNQPNSIGRYVTHGCVRVGAKDLEILFQSVDTGTRVYIY